MVYREIRRRTRTDDVGPAVSVIIPVHNGAAYLADAIGSVLTQTFRSFESLVVDAGSTDNGVEVIARHGSSILAYPRNPRNG